MADKPETPDERNHRLIQTVVDRARELVAAWDDDQEPNVVGDALLAVSGALTDLITAPEGEGDDGSEDAAS